ncbi:WD40-repeat-containing domain protein [Phakopsora pachyrhizi]|nr:WD40-repeat-containing domain protein [Phakopsora pachyrhizi]
MTFPSDLPSSDLPSSPTFGLSHRSRPTSITTTPGERYRNQLFGNENQLHQSSGRISSYSSRRRSLSSQRRSSTARSYRQSTLAECLNRCASSPLQHRVTRVDDFAEASSSLLQSEITELESELEDDFSDEYDEGCNGECLKLGMTKLLPLNYGQIRSLQHSSKRIKPSAGEGSQRLISSDAHRLMSSDGLEPSLNKIFNFEQRKPPRRSRFQQKHPHEIIGLEMTHSTRGTDPRKMEILKSLWNSHVIKMWNPEYEAGFEYPFSLCFNHAAKLGESGRPPSQGELMAVAGSAGTVSLYHPCVFGPTEVLGPLSSFQGVKNGIFGLSFSPSDQMIGTGAGQEVSEIFDVETGNLIYRLEDHTGTVKSIEFCPANEMVVATASRDGSIKIWDLRIQGSRISDAYDIPIHKPVITIRNAHDDRHIGKKRKKGAHLPSVSSVLWASHTDKHLFSAGSANGVVKLWDIRKKTPFSWKSHPVPAEESIETSTCGFPLDDHESDGLSHPQRPHGISSLISSSDGSRLYSLGTDSVIRTHDSLRLSRPPTNHLKVYKDPKLIATSLFLKLSISNDDRFLANGTSTGDIFIWDLSSQERAVKKKSTTRILDSQDRKDETSLEEDRVILNNAHNKDICGLDFWRQGLGSCSDDSDVKVWTYKDAWLEEIDDVY